jgi:hypothetical protein
MTEAELQKLTKELEPEKLKQILEKLETMFEMRVSMHLGDGVFPGEPDAHKNRIEVKYRGETWYFDFIDGVKGVNLVKKEALLRNQFRAENITCVQKNDDEALWAYYQLNFHPWIEILAQ